MKKSKIIIILMSLLLVLAGCGKKETQQETETNTEEYTSEITTKEIFSDRDLEQSITTTDATTYTVENNKDINITEAGVYVLKGNSKNTTITINTDSDSKVQLVLDGLVITNESTPCIYVKNADKVFITTKGTNELTVTDEFTADGDTNTDAVIFAKDDITINGVGSLTIKSSENGISAKDDLKITGGTINVTSTLDSIEANNSISIADGTITINSSKDGLHAEYDEDDSVGYIYIAGGKLNITAKDDAIQATTILKIDAGEITTNSGEGLEATVVEINGGTTTIKASDDGINASSKSTKYTPTVTINNGNLTINMGQGDTDAIDSNGNLYINGGTIDITAQSPFDYNGTGKYNGGKITVNGSEVTELSNQMMGGKGGGHGEGIRPEDGGVPKDRGEMSNQRRTR